LRDGQRPHLVDGLARDAERLAAGGDDVEPATGGEKLGDDLGGLAGHVLAVVDEQQAVHPAGDVTQHVAQRPAVARHDAQRPRDGVGNQRRFHRREIGQPRTVGESAAVTGADVQGQPRLAHPARAGERDQAVPVDECGQLGGLDVAADEAGQRHRQCRAGPGGAAQIDADLGQGGPVVGAQLAQQGGDVALDGPHRHVEPLGDLLVPEPLGHRVENLGLALRHAGAGQALRQAAVGGRHGGIVRRCRTGTKSVSAQRPVDSGVRSAVSVVESVHRTDEVRRPDGAGCP
jgi:hypothetical protein